MHKSHTTAKGEWVRGADAKRPRRVKLSRKHFWLTALVSTGIYAVLIGVLLDPLAQPKLTEAFGARPGGVPVVVVVAIVETLLFLPVPWFIWNASRIAIQAARDGRKPGLLYLLRVGTLHPHLRVPQRISLLGLAYFLMIFAAWISFTSVRGI